MAMATLASGGAKNIDKSNNLQDASFSSYLNYSEGIYLRKLAESGVNQNSIIIAPHEHLYFGRKKAVEGEIGVFGAEKYFNGCVDEKDTTPRVGNNNGSINYQYVKDELPVDIGPVKKEAGVDIGPVKQKIQPGTPSIHSESSWNSQSAFLQNVLGNPHRRKASRRRGKKSLLSSLRCNCGCNDKSSVDIDEQSGESNSKGSVGGVVVQGKTIVFSSSKEPIQNGPETVDSARTNGSQLSPLVAEEMQCKKIDEAGNESNREDCFSFPILSSKAGNLAVKPRLQEQDDNKPRKSIEVYGSPVLEKKIMASSDVESDASSDLFELESFKNNANPYLLRQASDGMSSCVTPTNCYAPSEASIEWSVVTASAADFSAMSDTEDLKTSSAGLKKDEKKAQNAKAAAGKEAERRRSGILLSCKSYKAVSVAGDAYRTNGKAVPDPEGTIGRSHLHQ